MGNDDEGESVSVAVRKIENGYVARHTKISGNDYKSKETFSSTKPKIGLSIGIEPKAEPSSLARAIEHLNKI